MLCVVNLVYLPRGLGLPRASKGQHPPDPHSTREKRHSLDATWLSCHVGQLADNVARHARFFRRSSDLRWSRERGQSPTERFVELAQLDGAGLLVFLQKAEGFPNDFASGVVAARLNLVVNECFQFGGERNVHKQPLS
jgi:hypothetical protein